MWPGRIRLLAVTVCKNTSDIYIVKKAKILCQKTTIKYSKEIQRGSLFYMEVGDPR